MAAFRAAWPQFTALADALGRTYQYLASGELKYFQHFDVVEAGVPVRVQLAVGNKGGITDIFLSARLRALVISTEVVVRQEHALDRLGKRLGIDREVQTGDAAFDAAVYIESDAADADVLRLFADARVRSTLMASTQFPSSHLAFAADEPFIHFVGDHLFVSDTAGRCVEQLVAAIPALKAVVSNTAALLASSFCPVCSHFF